MKLRSLLIVLILLGGLRAGAQLNTDRTLQSGRSALYFDDYQVAIQYFNQVIDAKPYLAEPYFLRAIAKYNLEDYIGARRDADRAVELNPFLPDAWEVRGVAEQCMGNNVEAIGNYQRALDLLPHNRQLLFNKAIAEEAADRFEAADSTYEELLTFYPRFDAGYVGRAQLNLHRADTVAARVDLNRALEINANSVGALVIRAALAEDPAEALADMDRAVTLQPDRTFLRVNRAVARYRVNDFNGAIDDLDYVLQQEPLNYEALFNRAMLRAELADNDRALRDLNRALELRPSDLRAHLNRAMVLLAKGEYHGAMADVKAVTDVYPEMFAAIALRGQINEAAGNTAGAQADFRLASRLAHSTKINADTDAPATDADTDAEATLARFKALQKADDSEATASAQTFNARGLKGRTSDNAQTVEMQPIYQLSYYTDADGPAVFDKEIEDLNAARVLPFVVFLTNELPSLTREADVERHFKSINSLTETIGSGRARPVDRFARAMDYSTLKDFELALGDLDAVIAAQPDFAPAYLQRAAVRYRIQEAGQGSVIVEGDAAELNARSAMVLGQIMDDLDRALALNPRMAVAHYNRGVVLMRLGAWADAIDAFTAAINIDPTLGSAYFNRGYAQFSRGNRDAAMTDISRAGQLGIHAAYPLLRRMQ
ncbi:MAG: tetratricopeptide repeat protein [Muribaculaceae bacterium]|nr:tetratricopeptide repeat protein [Muribaculaceae bacterium]